MNSRDNELLQDADRKLAAGQLVEATTIARDVLKRHQRSVPALEIIAAAAFQDARFDDARLFLNRCIKLKPRDAALRVRLAQIYGTEGQYAEGLKVLDAASAIDPRQVSPALRGSFLARNGDVDDARAVLSSHVRDNAAAALEMAQIELNAGNAERALEIADHHSRAQHPQLRGSLHRVMGKASEKLGRYDDAFSAYHAAHQPPHGMFDPKAFVELMDRIVGTFTLDTIRSLERGHHGSEVPVFVVGMPRSGTSLVDRIIDAHPHAAGGDELPDLTRIVRGLPGLMNTTTEWPECVGEMSGTDADRIARPYLKRLAKVGRRASRVTNKNMDNHHYIGLIQVLFPEARIIEVTRDPLDTCLSCFASDLQPENHAYAADLGHLGLAHRQFERLMNHWRSVVDLRWHSVTYESLIADQPGETRKLIEFLGLDWDDGCLRYFETGRLAHTLSREQANKPIYRSSIGRHVPFGSHLDPLRAALID